MNKKIKFTIHNPNSCYIKNRGLLETLVFRPDDISITRSVDDQSGQTFSGDYTDESKDVYLLSQDGIKVERDLKQDKVTIRDLDTGDQDLIAISNIVDEIKKRLE